VAYDLNCQSMPKQAPLRLIKRCRLYIPRGELKIPSITRGMYVLYKEKPGRNKKKTYEVFYIGVGGVSAKARTGLGRRIKNHAKTKEGWTHYSFFEVHDNVSHKEILELEGLFLRVFRDDPRVKLDNKQHGATILKRLSKDSASVWQSKG
jgi:hypothetical protein